MSFFCQFAGDIVLVAYAGDIFRGFVESITIENGGPLFKVKFKCYSCWSTKQFTSDEVKPDNIIDPPHWNKEGKAIGFCNASEYQHFGGCNFRRYLVFRCEFCGKYTSDLENHKVQEHPANIPTSTTPIRGSWRLRGRQNLYPLQRCRRNLNDLWTSNPSFD